MTTYSYFVKPQAFYTDIASVTPAQPMVFDYADIPVFRFSFLPNAIQAGDTLVFASDDDMIFYSDDPGNILHSASCMIINKHVVTEDEAALLKVEMPINTRTIKFRDTVNGKIRPVDVMTALYVLRDTGDDKAYSVLAKGRGLCNAIIADYDSLPEPITTGEYYTKSELDKLLAEKAEASALQAHVDDADIHVTLDDKSKWDSKADIQDITDAVDGLATVAKSGSYNDLMDKPVLATVATTGSYNDLTDQPVIPEANDAKITITQGGIEKGSFTLNQADPMTIEVDAGGADAVKQDAYDADNLAIETSLDNFSTSLDNYLSPPDATNYFNFVSIEDGSTLEMPANDKYWNPKTVLEWSLDRSNWTVFHPTTESLPVQTLNVDQRIWFRGENDFEIVNDCYGGPYAFVGTGKFELDGNMNSFWHKDLSKCENGIRMRNFFYNGSFISGLRPTFKLPSCAKDLESAFGYTMIKSLPEFPDTYPNLKNCFFECHGITSINVALKPGLIECMFWGCRSMTDANLIIDAEQVSDLSHLFVNCEKLEHAEIQLIHGERIRKTITMFNNCTQLKSIPNFFSDPKLEMIIDCTSMFLSCNSISSIVSPPSGALRIQALYGGCLNVSKIPDGFTIGPNVMDWANILTGSELLSEIGNDVSFLAPCTPGNPSLGIPVDKITTIGNNFKINIPGLAQTDPYQLFPNLKTLGTNCNINGTITNPVA